MMTPPSDGIPRRDLQQRPSQNTVMLAFSDQRRLQAREEVRSAAVPMRVSEAERHKKLFLGGAGPGLLAGRFGRASVTEPEEALR